MTTLEAAAPARQQAATAAAPQIVRYGELIPCKTAFIDAHTPGSNQKENFTIIGGGVSESPDQHVHIRETPGFNIGAAGQPPGCRNSLHSHRTAEVFFVLRFRKSTAGPANGIYFGPDGPAHARLNLITDFVRMPSQYLMVSILIAACLR